MSQDSEAGHGPGLPAIVPRLPLLRKRGQWVMNKSKCFKKVILKKHLDRMVIREIWFSCRWQVGG